jgi:hypothetical protein
MALDFRKQRQVRAFGRSGRDKRRSDIADYQRFVDLIDLVTGKIRITEGDGTELVFADIRGPIGVAKKESLDGSGIDSSDFTIAVHISRTQVATGKELEATSGG